MKSKNKSKKKQLKQKRVINPIQEENKIIDINAIKLGYKDGDFRNIKSKYILKIIFNHLRKVKLFPIIKYNKKLQSELKFNFHDYREYIHTLSPIEIELKLVDNEYGKFINIPEEDKDYYHIYFNNSSKETKRNYTNEKDQVKAIKIIIDHQVTSLRYLFDRCYCVQSIVFNEFTRNNITDMNGMFKWCKSLKILDLSNFNPENVTDMREMFFCCSSLTELNLSKFNSKIVIKDTNMREMFFECLSLEKIIFSDFYSDYYSDDNIDSDNNKNKKFNYDIKNIFDGCKKLKKIEISDFNSDKKIIEFSENKIREIKKINHPILNCYVKYLNNLEIKKNEDNIIRFHRFRWNRINHYNYGY